MRMLSNRLLFLIGLPVLIFALVFFGVVAVDKSIPKKFSVVLSRFSQLTPTTDLAEDKTHDVNAKNIKSSINQREEKNYKLENGFFSKDQTKFFFTTSKRNLFQLDIKDGALTSLGSSLALSGLSSPDSALILADNGVEAFDLASRQKVPIAVGVFTEKRNHPGITGIGFGPSANSYLFFNKTENAWMMQNIFDRSVIWKTSGSNPPAEDFSGKWTTSRNFVYLTSSDANYGAILDSKNGKFISVGPRTASPGWLVEDDAKTRRSLLFISGWDLKTIDSFHLDLQSEHAEPLDFSENPLAFSTEEDFLLTLRGKSLRVRKPSAKFSVISENSIPTLAALTPVRIPNSHLIAFFDGHQLQILDFISNVKKSVGPQYEEAGQGLLVVSDSGHLVAHSVGRKLQVYWRSEIEKASANYLTANVVD